MIRMKCNVTCISKVWLKVRRCVYNLIEFAAVSVMICVLVDCTKWDFVIAPELQRQKKIRTETKVFCWNQPEIKWMPQKSMKYIHFKQHFDLNLFVFVF